jgi:hypothetical protein
VKDVVQEDLRGHCPRGQRRSFCESSFPLPPALTWLHVCVPFEKTKKRGPRPRRCEAAPRVSEPRHPATRRSEIFVWVVWKTPRVGWARTSCAQKFDVCALLCPLNELNSYTGLVPVTAPHHHHYRDLRNLAPVSLFTTLKTMLPMHTIPSNYCHSGNNWRTGPPLCTLSSNARERDRQSQRPTEIYRERERERDRDRDRRREAASIRTLPKPTNLEPCLNPQMPLARCNLQAPSTPTLSGLRQRQACSTSMKAQGPQV